MIGEEAEQGEGEDWRTSEDQDAHVRGPNGLAEFLRLTLWPEVYLRLLAAVGFSTFFIFYDQGFSSLLQSQFSNFNPTNKTTTILFSPRKTTKITRPSGTVIIVTLNRRFSQIIYDILYSLLRPR